MSPCELPEDRARPTRRLVVAFVVVSVLLLLAVLGVAYVLGVGGGRAGDTGATERHGQANPFRIVAYQGADVLGGNETDFRDLLGRGKPVVLNFWAGLCAPCRTEMPSFERAYGRYQDRLVLVGVDIGPFLGLGSHDDARTLLKSLGVSYPTAYATDRRIIEEYQLLAMPTTLFFAADGSLRRKWVGVLTESQLEQEFEMLVSGQ